MVDNNYRRPTSEYIESRDEYLYDDEIDFRLRLDSEAVELLESDPDSFDSNSSPCCSADHSPHLTDKGRVTGGSGTDDPLLVNSSRHEDNDNVSDESGYSDDKDVISSSSSVASATSSLAAKMAAAKGIPYGIIAEEFTLNLWLSNTHHTRFAKKSITKSITWNIYIFCFPQFHTQFFDDSTFSFP